MPTIPTVNITVEDNGSSAALSVPQQNVQLVIGCAVGGTVNRPYASTSPGGIQTQFVGGQLVEAGGMIASVGNVAICISCPIVTTGTVRAPAALTGATSSGGSPADTITKTAHGLVTGDVVTISGMTTDTDANGTWVITVTGANTFTIPTAGSGSAGSGGTITPLGIVATVPGGSTSTLTTTLDSTNGAWDDYYVKVKCLVGGTVGTAGIQIQVSLDAGRNWGPPIAIGTATSLYLGSGTISSPAAGGTGITIDFGAGTMVAGDTWQFSTIAPAWNDAGLSAALAAFFASQYAVEGVGSVHIVGTCASGDISAVQTALQSGVAGYVFTRAIVDLRDASPPAAWGGTGETESTWIAALATVVAGETAQPRIAPDGGHYNMTSPYANPAGGLPAYRRCLAWAHAVRRTQIPPQRRAGRVKDGPYAQIVVNPATDPSDGFIYHDERVTPGLNAARIGSAMTWPKKGQGFFQCQEPLLSAPGSQFTELAIGNVLDAACDIGYAAGVEEVSDDLKVQQNGTLDPVDLNTFQGDLQNALNEGMVQTPLVSSVLATVSPTANVLATGIIPVTISVTPRAYANAISETINLSNGG